MIVILILPKKKYHLGRKEGFGNAVKHGVKYEYVTQSIYEHE